MFETTNGTPTRPLSKEDLEEIMKALNAVIQCPFEKFANARGFSLKDGDILFLPGGWKAKLEELPVVIPSGVRFSPYIDSPMLVKAKLLKGWVKEP